MRIIINVSCWFDAFNLLNGLDCALSSDCANSSQEFWDDLRKSLCSLVVVFILWFQFQTTFECITRLGVCSIGATHHWHTLRRLIKLEWNARSRTRYDSSKPLLMEVPVCLLPASFTPIEIARLAVVICWRRRFAWLELERLVSNVPFRSQQSRHSYAFRSPMRSFGCWQVFEAKTGCQFGYSIASSIKLPPIKRRPKLES